MNVVGKAAKMYQYRKSCRQDTNLTCQIEYNVSIYKKDAGRYQKEYLWHLFLCIDTGRAEKRGDFERKRIKKQRNFL